MRMRDPAPHAGSVPVDAAPGTLLIPVWAAVLGTCSMLFYSFFRSLVGKDVVVELKNDLSICGTLYSVDQCLSIRLSDTSVTDPEKCPHLLWVEHCLIGLGAVLGAVTCR